MTFDVQPIRGGRLFSLTSQNICTIIHARQGNIFSLAVPFNPLYAFRSPQRKSLGMLAAHPASSPSFDIRLPPSTVHGLPSTVHRPIFDSPHPPSTVPCPLSELFRKTNTVQFYPYRSSSYIICSTRRNDLFLFCSSETNPIALRLTVFRLPGKERSSRRETLPAIFTRDEFERLVSLPHHSIRATINL